MFLAGASEQGVEGVEGALLGPGPKAGKLTVSLWPINPNVPLPCTSQSYYVIFNPKPTNLVMSHYTHLF